MFNIDTSQPQVQAALVSSVGVVLSILSTLYVARRNIHKDARARARIEWIGELRAYLSELVTAIDQVRRARLDGRAQDIPDRTGEMLRAKVKIVLMLSPEDAHQSFGEAISKCVEKVQSEGLNFDPGSSIAAIVTSAKALMHTEWSKAAHGK